MSGPRRPNDPATVALVALYLVLAAFALAVGAPWLWAALAPVLWG